MKRSFITYIILVITAFFSHVVSADNTLAAQINLSKSQVLNKRVFGIHGELLWSPIRLGDPLLSSVYNDVGFQDIRLPGGAAGNHYLSQTENFGCNKSENIGKKTKNRIKKYNVALSRKNRSYSTEDFLSLIKETKTDFTLIINILCDTPENTRKWMEKIRNSGVTVKYAEMGSEYYFDEYLWAFPLPVNYIKQAERHAIEVRRIFPDVKIGVDTSNASYRSEYFPDFSKMAKNERYKRGLAYDNLAASASFADAFIVHLYSPLGTTRKDKALNTIDNRQIYQNIISFFDGRIMPSMQYLHKLNLNKKIWVTEWGAAFYGWRRKHESSFLRTHYNALYVINAMLTYFSVPYVESTNYHNFPNLWSDFKKLQPNPLYHAMKLFKDPLLKMSAISPISFQGIKLYTGTHSHYKGKSLELNSVFFHNDVEGYVFIVNKFGRHYSFNSISSVGGVFNVQPIDFEQIVPDTTLNNNFEKILQYKKIINKQVAIDIPAYSITKIHVKIVPESVLNKQKIKNKIL